ncbi:hypothetical protein GCM10011391_18780 [Pullulanibacillus camelliae]|uniref:DUF4129 domain-containing protein n=1 Tax=Pullulanibacillus camelliae TaxID=1707096 RepID=A0A8J2YH34_9BACL|nr:DUF4129 domain-containing protein [Pullulanibacillus camelliae]GGE40251.1 hypothetical protein GCM10011391_18780 [Pullulanibacillus camelliae]
MKWLIRKVIEGIIEGLVVLPILLLISIYLLPNTLHIIWMASLLVLFIAGVIVRARVKNKKRGVYLLLSVLIGSIGTLSFLSSLLITLVIEILAIGVVYRGIIHAEREWEESLPLIILWGSLPIYFVGYFLFGAFNALMPYQSLLTWLGIMTLVIVLFVNNHRQLMAAALSNQKRPFLSRAVLWQNRGYIVILLLIILLVINYRLFPYLFSKLASLFSYIIQVVLAIFPHRSKSTINQPSTAQVPPFLKIEARHPSIGGEVLEKIMMGLAYVFLCAAVLFLIFIIYKKLKPAITRYFQKLLLYMNQLFQQLEDQSQALGYQEEREMLFQDWRHETKEKLKRGLSQWQRTQRWEDLQTNQERIRFLFRQLLFKEMKQGYIYQSHHTPRETLDKIKKQYPGQSIELESLEKLYEKARYSPHSISNQEVKRTKEKIENYP